MKVCTKCKLEKELVCFFKDKKTKDGLRYQCIDCDKAKFARWRAANKESNNQQARTWNQQHKDIVVERAKKWNKEHREYYNAMSKMRKKHVKQATPPWADTKQIIEFYKNCPEGYHVDHIIPLRGKTVCGLHVIENLQYLPAEENLKKSNKVEL